MKKLILALLSWQGTTWAAAITGNSWQTKTFKAPPETHSSALHASLIHEQIFVAGDVEVMTGQQKNAIAYSGLIPMRHIRYKSMTSMSFSKSCLLHCMVSAAAVGRMRIRYWCREYNFVWLAETGAGQGVQLDPTGSMRDLLMWKSSVYSRIAGCQSTCLDLPRLA
jgi:hypothetical protein